MPLSEPLPESEDGAPSAATSAEARLAAVLAASDDDFAFYRRIPGEPIDFEVTFLRPNARHAYVDATKLIGTRLSKWLQPAEIRHRFPRYARVLETGVADRFEFVQWREGQQLRWVANVVRTSPDEIAVAFTDVTEQRRVEEALRDSEHRFRTVKEASPDGFMIVDVARADGGYEMRLSYVNPTAERLFGIAPGAWKGRLVADAMEPLTRGEVWAAAHRVVQSGEIVQLEAELHAGKGEAWFRVHIVPLGSGITVTLADVTRRRRGEQALATIAELSEVLTTSLDEATIVERLMSRLVPASADAAVLVLADEDGLLHVAGVADGSSPSPPWRPAFENALKTGVLPLGVARAFTSRGGVVFQATAPLSEGLGPDASAALDCRTWMTAPVLIGQQVMGALGVGRRERGSVYERTDLALLEEIARRAGLAIENARLYEAAQLASRLKDEFLAVVSHEVRTPLTAIAAWTTILRNDGGRDPARLAKGLGVIERNVHSQTRIIEDILDVSRIITGKLRLDLQAVSLDAIVRDAAEVVRPAAAAKGITLRLEGVEEPFPVEGDPDRLRQVFWNILSNAVKFAEPGGHVEAKVARVDGALVVTVTDDGQGIDPEFLPHVFERFRQADASRARRHGGLGLGLAIVRHLVEMHGGTVQAASDGRGRGTTFTVTLPARAAEAFTASEGPVTAPQVPGRGLQGVSLLVVEDEEDLRELIAAALRLMGAEVDVAAEATSALDAVERRAYDVVVTDIGMPGRDGFWLLGALRGLRPQLCVIGMSAYAHADDVRRARDAGFAAYLTKPLQPDTIAAAIEKCLGRAAA